MNEKHLFTRGMNLTCAQAIRKADGSIQLTCWHQQDPPLISTEPNYQTALETAAAFCNRHGVPVGTINR